MQWHRCGFSVDHRHYSSKEILVAHGVDEIEAIWCSRLERGILVGGERGHTRRGNYQWGGGSLLLWNKFLRSVPQIQLSSFLVACLFSFVVETIRNELCPLGFSRHCRGRIKSLFYLAWTTRASVGSRLSLVHSIIFSSS